LLSLTVGRFVFRLVEANMASFHFYVLGGERSEARNRVLHKNIHRRLHKTPRGVCRTRNNVVKNRRYKADC
jgi:hypothetical protein